MSSTPSASTTGSKTNPIYVAPLAVESSLVMRLHSSKMIDHELFGLFLIDNDMIIMIVAHSSKAEYCCLSLSIYSSSLS